MSNIAPQTPPAPTPGPGWYDDGSGTRRWWDGANWSTQYVAPPAVVQRPFSGVAVAGFILALAGAVTAYVGPAGVTLGALGMVFSCVGISATAQMRGRGLAVAGVIISALAILGGLSRVFTG